MSIAAVLVLATAFASYAPTPQGAGLHAVGYPATVPHVVRINVVGRFATMTFRGAIMEGEPVHEAVLVEKFSFGWQALEVLNFSCRLSIHRDAFAVRARLMDGMPSFESFEDACRGQSVDAGPAADIETIRKAMQGPLVPGVVVSGSYAAAGWYGGGGGEAIFHKIGNTWTWIAGGGGDHSASELKALGVPDSASCAFGKLEACVRKKSAK